MSYRSKEYYYISYSLRYSPPGNGIRSLVSSLVTRKGSLCDVDSQSISVSQRVGELQERTEQMQKELAQLSEQFQAEQVQSKLKRAELEERVRREREEDKRREAGNKDPPSILMYV
jgi:TolA-binding protein